MALPLNPDHLVKPVCEIAEAAGAEILQHYNRVCAVELKENRSPVTAADRAAHRLIVDALSSLTPGTPVVSEESDDAAGSDLNGAERFWLVDPLDGTKEFLKKTGEFTVNIALVSRREPVLGVVYAPCAGLLYHAEREAGAWVRSSQGPSTRIRTGRADASRLRIVASKDHSGPLTRAVLERAPGATTLSMGSSLKFCLVAEGKADLYIRDATTMEWDTAAAHCVLASAGGAVRELRGGPLLYRKPGFENPMFLALGDLALPWERLIN